MIENIYKQVIFELDVLYNQALIHNVTNDFEEYHKCIGKFANICEILGIPTEQYIFKINLKNKPKEENQ